MPAALRYVRRYSTAPAAKPATPAVAAQRRVPSAALREVPVRTRQRSKCAAYAFGALSLRQRCLPV